MEIYSCYNTNRGIGDITYVSELIPHLLDIKNLTSLYSRKREYQNGAGSIRTYRLASLRSLINDVLIEGIV